MGGRRLWPVPIGGGMHRSVVLLLASGGVLWCGWGLGEMSLPSVGDGAATGLLDLVRELSTAGAGRAATPALFAGMLAGMAVLAVTLYREYLDLFSRHPAYSRGRLAFRGILAAGPSAVFVWVAAQGLAVLVSFLLLWFAVLLVSSALRQAVRRGGAGRHPA